MIIVLKSRDQIKDILATNPHLSEKVFSNLIYSFEKQFRNYSLPSDVIQHEQCIPFILNNPKCLLNTSFFDLLETEDINKLLSSNIFILPYMANQSKIKDFVKANPNYNWRLKDIITNTFSRYNTDWLIHLAKVYCIIYNEHHDIDSLLFFKDKLFYYENNAIELYKLYAYEIDTLSILSNYLDVNEETIKFFHSIFAENCKEIKSINLFAKTCSNWISRFNDCISEVCRINNYDSITDKSNEVIITDNTKTDLNNRDSKYSFYTNWNNV